MLLLIDELEMFKSVDVHEPLRLLPSELEYLHQTSQKAGTVIIPQRKWVRNR